MSGQNVLAKRHELMAKGQAERLFPMLNEILNEAGANWREINRIGVGKGPGNFTSIRLAISAVRGLSLGLKIPALGVSVLDALAHDTHPKQPLICAIDARAGKVYVQLFGRELRADTQATLMDLSDLPADWNGLHVVGSAAAKVAEKLNGTVVPAQFAPASAIARIALNAQDTQNQRPVPLDLRAADAAPSRDLPPAIIP